MLGSWHMPKNKGHLQHRQLRRLSRFEPKAPKTLRHPPNISQPADSRDGCKYQRPSWRPWQSASDLPPWCGANDMDTATWAQQRRWTRWTRWTWELEPSNEEFTMENEGGNYKSWKLNGSIDLRMVLQISQPPILGFIGKAYIYSPNYVWLPSFMYKKTMWFLSRNRICAIAIYQRVYLPDVFWHMKWE